MLLKDFTTSRNQKNTVIRFITCLFAAMAFTSPWFIGGNYPFTRTALVAVCAIVLLLVAAELIRDPETSRIRGVPFIYWILLFGVGFTLFQAMPQSIAIRPVVEQQLDTSEGLADQVLDRQDGPRSVSVYAPATRRKLVDLLYGVSLFVCASLVLKERQSIFAVFATLTAAGVLVALVGVVQILSDDTRLLWQYELLWGGDPFGPFVNSNNAAGFLLICLSASTFFIAQMLLSSAGEGNAVDGLSNVEPGSHVTRRFALGIFRLQSEHLYFLTAVIVISAAIPMTGSRGGLLAFGGCAVFTALLMLRANLPAVIGVSLAVIACAVVVVSYSEQADRVSEEIQSFQDFEVAAAPRLEHWKEAVPFGWTNARLGTGNGTYRLVSPGFGKTVFAKTFAHAENVYIETLVEMGIGGVVLLLWCIAYCVLAGSRLYRRDNVLDWSLAITGFSCLAGQVLIAVTDFGIYQPANITAMALLMGAVVGRSMPSHSQNTNSKVLATSSAWVKASIVTLLALAACWAVYESWGIELRRSAQRSIKLLNEYGSQGPTKTRLVSLPAVRKQLELAEKIRPDDYHIQLLLGDLEISEFRLKRARGLRDGIREQIEELDSLDGPSEEIALRREQLKSLDPPSIWGMTAVSLVHQGLRRLQRTNPKLSNEIFDDPAVKLHLVAAHERFCRAETLCRLLPHTRVRIARLAAFADHEDTGASREQEEAHIKAALARATPKSQTLFHCGLVALNSGNQELAVELWGKCLRQPHSGVQERLIIEFCLQLLPMKMLYEVVLPQKPEYLLRVAGHYLGGPEMALPKKFLVVHIQRLIENSSDLGELEKKLLLANAARRIEDYPTAVENYSGALSLAPKTVPWRYDYAFALFMTKQFDEAVRQLKVCELDPSVRKNRISWLLKRIRRERLK